MFLFLFFPFFSQSQSKDPWKEIILTETLKNRAEIEKQNAMKDKTIRKIELRENVFQELRGSEQGGAIFIHNPFVYMKIFESLFIGCSATKNGGAIYVESTRFDLYQSVFLECYILHTLWSGQAFMSLTNVFSTNETTVNFCPPSLGHSGSESIILVGGVQSIQQLNTSHNLASSYASGLATSESVSFMFKRSVIYYNKSPNHIFAFIHLRPDDDVSYCNIIHNTVDNEGIIFISGGYCVLRKCVFKKNIGSLAVFNQAYGPGFLAIEECAIDVPQENVLSGQPNLYNLGSVFTRKPSKHQLPKNRELIADFLEKMNRYSNVL